MRPVFVGNFEFDTRQSELERLFSKYGRVDRVDIKSADAIRSLDNVSFGRDRRRLSVEWARGERGKPHDGSKIGSQRPTKTLFVINFDSVNTRTRDVEKHFEPYGKVLSVRIRKNFAFVHFESQEDATQALERTHMSKLLDRVISVEYALRDDDDRGSPRGGGYGRRGDIPNRRSPSPITRSRPSPDYGRGRNPAYERNSSGRAYDRHDSPELGQFRRSYSPLRR